MIAYHIISAYLILGIKLQTYQSETPSSRLGAEDLRAIGIRVTSAALSKQGGLGTNKTEKVIQNIAMSYNMTLLIVQ